MIAVIGCGGKEPPAPTAIGTLMCKPEWTGVAADLDQVESTAMLQREVVAGVTDTRFVHRVVVHERYDATAERAVSAEPVKDSRVVEVGVALPDRDDAIHLCNVILDTYVLERRTGDPSRRDPFPQGRNDVQLLDRCHAASLNR